MANALGTGTHKRKESYASQVLAISRAETNIYDDFQRTMKRWSNRTNNGSNKRWGGKSIRLWYQNGIELQTSGTDYLPLPIDKDYGVNELIDGYEAEAVPDNLVAQRIDSAGYSIGMKKNKWLLRLY